MLRLASRSPRRAHLLEAAGIPFRPGPYPDVDETPPPGLDPPQAARALAERKARAAARLAPLEVVAAADTIVFVDGEMLGKPRDDADARAMLARLSGRTHHVATGVAVAAGGRVASDVAVSAVTFRSLAPEEIAAYVAGGEPRDKAGAYAIQGGAAAFVTARDGDLDTVVGLPIQLLLGLWARIDPPGGQVRPGRGR